MRTVDEILRAMRGIVVNSGLHDGDMVDATAVHHAIIQYADELEEALKRKLIVPVDVWNDMVRKVENSGNSLAMRRALVEIRDCIKEHPCQLDEDAVFEIVTKALNEKPRNCDVGTAEEQTARFNEFCNVAFKKWLERWNIKLDQCSSCELSGNRKCALTWAQMPYTAEKGGAE